jgi:Rrf2 family nitric oxide-sensitive transcriptional repressor
MQLSKFSDYALRVIVHLAASPDRLLTTREIADIHGAKYHHMAKVTAWLVAEGFAVSLRGRSGGLRLAQDPTQISLGALLRQLEADKPLVDCLSANGGACRLSPSCGLTSALQTAQQAFFEVLDPMTVESVVKGTPGMANLLTFLNENSHRSA